jgi:CRISPR-associated protein Cst1
MTHLQYSGHWMVDVGLATIAALRSKNRIADLTEDDLVMAAEQIKRLYCYHTAVRNYLSVIFTNSHFVQATMSDADREAYADSILYAFQSDQAFTGEGLRCPFFPERAAHFTAFRQHVPLLNGEGISNFSPAGRAGLPISGLALLAIHAMPLGCVKCGQMLAFHQVGDPTDPNAGRMTTVLARQAWQEKITHINILSPNDSSGKLPNVGGSAKTRYITSVLKAVGATRERDLNIDYLTGYYFTNYGPSPRVELVRLDHTVLRFVQLAALDASDAWNRVTYVAWRLEKGEKRDEMSETTSRRNNLYEKLFDLPDNPLAFLEQLKRGESWDLIAIFLKEVMLMEQERIETYRRLGDTLFDYATRFENQPLSFYTQFSRAKAYIALRSIIRTAAEKMYRANSDSPLFSYDDFILAFEHPSEAYSQWRLARDLISIRLLERLYELNIDLSNLPDIEDETEDN